ncbi:unnamed protein product, partial [marine sediment metagenome]
ASTWAYIFATTLGLLSAYFLNRIGPNVNPLAKFFVVPALVIYVSYKILLFIFPNINTAGNRVRRYFQDKSSTELNSIGYVEIFPPLLAVFVILIILLYTGFF